MNEGEFEFVDSFSSEWSLLEDHTLDLGNLL
jgi:hypothetical protein